MADPYEISRVRTSPSGVPLAFNKLSGNGKNFLIQKSNLNKFQQRVSILNEHVKDSSELISTVTSSNIVGQIFKSSHDNITAMSFAAKAKQDVTIDNFESYADSAALQAAWVADDELAILNATVYPTGSTQSMQLDAGNDSTDNDTWEIAVASTDLTGSTGSLFIQQNKIYNDCKMRFYIGDGTNTKSAPLIIQNKDQWEEIEVPAALLTEDGGGTTDITAIIAVGIRLEKKKRDAVVYIDLLSAALNPGSLTAKLWDMGVVLPTAGVTSIDDGDQYTKLGDLGITGVQIASVNISLIGGLRQYCVHEFSAGVAIEMANNEVLEIDHYYAITFNFVDEDIEIYGPDASVETQYNNGYSFNAASEAAAITATGTDEDLQFLIFSNQAAYMRKMILFVDATPGINSCMSINIEDENKKITDVIASGIQGRASINVEFSFPYLIPKGGKFEVNYNDDPDDSTSFINGNMQYFFDPNGTNG